MGTRCLIHIKDNERDSQTLVTIYRQYDGYLNGMGHDILNALNKGKAEVINGYGRNETPSYFNTMGCLAAHLVSQLKKKIGNVYIYPTDSKDVGEEYTYTLYLINGKLHMEIQDDHEIIFDEFELARSDAYDILENYKKDE